MSIRIAAIAVFGAMLVSPAFAGDPTGFYVGIGGIINHTDDTDASGTYFGTPVKVKNIESHLGWGGDVFAGYNFNGPRIEAEAVYRNSKTRNLGSLLGSEARVQSAALMVNVLYEFFASEAVSPYVGVGAGAAYVWATGPGHTNDTVFAYQGIAGANLKMSPNWVLSADYRYFRTADPTFKDSGAKVDTEYVNHTAMVGLTYRFVEPPRPVAAAQPAASGPPAPPRVRSYIVFFGFDRTDITPQALATIRQAAQAASEGGVERLNVTGHTDRVGSEQYNMALSLRRANAVKDALIREGVASSEIVVIGRGESRPLVPTADGVREAQNRRVEIVLQ